ncbi:type II toxin-antitoxin system RelE/ParE family toxin [Sphaerotilus sp.]|uniref:type II toxin-antitoxin system RelE family toxin n=1 Tax=Sphaerotilus sp. TaxID=2093942 RepID=UPI002ACEBB98|nr:type II toxin-antitoxin system RelE/ParE family toxin [Sphaerotilus sp.]MDZ7858838.1 type II toxin-antitoxin system RelE/ParE family toxin [Sphaerotilus sp.]
MTYELRFRTSALKEWRKLDGTLQAQFKKKLQERLEQPHVPSSALSGLPDAYKIKLRQSGYRLVYTVEDAVVTVTVVAVGKREKNAVYDVARARLRGA